MAHGQQEIPLSGLTGREAVPELVQRDRQFRDAHEAVALAVRAAESRGCDLPDLGVDGLRDAMQAVAGAGERLADDVAAALTVEGALQARSHIGGTAPDQVRAAIARARGRMG